MVGTENINLTVNHWKVWNKPESLVTMLCSYFSAVCMCQSEALCPCRLRAQTLLWCHQQGHIEGTTSSHSAPGFTPPLNSQTHTPQPMSGWVFPFVYVCVLQRKQKSGRNWICVSVYTAHVTLWLCVCRQDRDCLHAYQDALASDDVTPNLSLKLWSCVYVPWQFAMVTSLPTV